MNRFLFRQVERLKRGLFTAFGMIVLSSFLSFPNSQKGPSYLSADKQYGETKTAISEELRIKDVFSQPYYYLGSGGQSDVFSSADGQYVLKLFKKKKGKRRKEHTFASCALAHRILQEETGIFYLHLNQTDHLPFSFPLPSGIPINLNSVAFLVQKKGKRIDEYLEEKGRARETIQVITKQLLSLQFSLLSKGVRNKDPNIHSNYGFIEDQPFLLDTGRLSQVKDTTKEREKIRIRTKKWAEYIYRNE